MLDDLNPQFMTRLVDRKGVLLGVSSLNKYFAQEGKSAFYDQVTNILI